MYFVHSHVVCTRTQHGVVYKCFSIYFSYRFIKFTPFVVGAWLVEGQANVLLWLSRTEPKKKFKQRYKLRERRNEEENVSRRTVG